PPRARRRAARSRRRGCAAGGQSWWRPRTGREGDAATVAGGPPGSACPAGEGNPTRRRRGGAPPQGGKARPRGARARATGPGRDDLAVAVDVDDGEDRRRLERVDRGPAHAGGERGRGQRVSVTRRGSAQPAVSSGRGGGVGAAISSASVTRPPA